jgi:hypothetical protein
MEPTTENLLFCEGQILRFKATHFFDRVDQFVLTDLRDVLNETAKTQAEAELIVSACLRTYSTCPSPAELIESAERIRQEARSSKSWQPEWVEKASPSCPKCFGGGYQFFYHLHTYDGFYTHKEQVTRQVYESLAGKLDPKKQRIYSSVKPCDCGTPLGTPKTPPMTEEEWTETERKMKAYLEGEKQRKAERGNREGLKRAADIVRDIMAPKVRPITPEDVERARDEGRRKREAEEAKPETESNEQ